MPVRTSVVLGALTVSIFLLVGSFASSESAAQVVVQGMSIRAAAPIVQATPPTSVNAVAAPGAGTNTNPAVNAQAAAAQKESPEDALVNLLVAAQYQRTTKAILEAWSQNDQEDKKEEEATPDSVGASVVNAFESLVVFELNEKSKFKAGDVISATLGEKSVGRFNVLSVDGKKVATKFVPPAVANSVAGPEKDSKPESTEESKENITDNSEASSQSVDDTKTETAANEDTGVTPETETTEDSAKPDTTVFPDIKTGDSVMLAVAVDKKVKADPQKKVDAFKRSVALAKWDEVKSFLNELEEENAAKVYHHVLKSLGKAATTQPQQPNGPTPPINFLTPGRARNEQVG
jgi:hypothetical protein